MTTFISSYTSLQKTIGALLPSYFFRGGLNHTVSSKVQDIAYQLFQGGSSLYLFSNGTAEIVQNVIKTPSLKTHNRIDLARNQALDSHAYHNLHGGLMASAGSFNIMNALHEFGLVHLNTLSQIISTAGSVLFLGANILSLEENVCLYNELQNIDLTEVQVDKRELNWLMQSALWGILNNLGYILTTTFLLFNGMTSIILFIAILSSLAGGIKILYDLSIWANKQNPLNEKFLTT